jgi:formate hydrogenlyase transcriptional activator
VVLCSGPVFRLPLGELGTRVRENSPVAAVRTLAEAQREHIGEVLREAGGVVGGREGAAARLGVARTTLIYRMQKLGMGTASMIK